ncbi:hypothetical protein EB796_007771 [Bugula neritina]|uniref:Uncharacterized protein n=1 Tax=Bugula neritina TaxID=10212 RepID=A0A7J7K5L0_BUGNE|nr:hypothetical protein EB796_007771 [Bugula neritina]
MPTQYCVALLAEPTRNSSLNSSVQPGLPNMASAFNFSSAPDSLNMRQAGAGRGYDMTDDASRTDSVAEYVLLHCLYISHYHK